MKVGDFDLDQRQERWRCVGQLWVDGKPAIKKNSRRIAVRADGGMFNGPSLLYGAWEKRATMLLMVQWRTLGNFKPIGSATQAVWLRVDYYYTANRPDLSNALHGVEDALQKAGALADDKWIEHHDGSRLHAVAKDQQGVKATLFVRD